MTEALELELVPEETEPAKMYGFLDEGDQQLRCFIFETIGHADIDGAIMIANMQAVFDWIKNGPAQPQQHNKRSPVRKVSDNG
jgi:hypothetical protein